MIHRFTQVGKESKKNALSLSLSLSLSFPALFLLLPSFRPDPPSSPLMLPVHPRGSHAPNYGKPTCAR